MKVFKKIRKTKEKHKKNLLLKDEKMNIIIKAKKKRKNTFNIFSKNFLLKVLLPILILLYLFFIIFLISKRKRNSSKKNNNIINNNNSNNTIYNSDSFEYFACFCALARQENIYAKELIEFYSNLGVEKFIFGDNNLPNSEKLADVLQDYISKGTVDIIDVFGSTIGLSEFYQIIYEKYKTRCGWFLYFDFDEYLEIFFKKNEKITLKEFLSNEIFANCESILFNWLVYTDNDLVFYDNRTLIERFTTPNNGDRDNRIVKSVVRGNLSKIAFYPNTSNHVPSSNLSICNSKGNKITRYNPFTVFPIVYDYGYLKHFTTKTAEEFCIKMKRGRTRGKQYDIDERVKLFFGHNKYSEEKMKVFETTFNKSFKRPYIRKT